MFVSRRWREVAQQALKRLRRHHAETPSPKALRVWTMTLLFTNP
jgi:hypothetical protein